MAGMKEQRITEEKPLLPEQRGPDSDAVSLHAFLTLCCLLWMARHCKQKDPVSQAALICHHGI